MITVVVGLLVLAVLLAIRPTRAFLFGVVGAVWDIFAGIVLRIVLNPAIWIPLLLGILLWIGFSYWGSTILGEFGTWMVFTGMVATWVVLTLLSAIPAVGVVFVPFRFISCILWVALGLFLLTDASPGFNSAAKRVWSKGNIESLKAAAGVDDGRIIEASEKSCIYDEAYNPQTKLDPVTKGEKLRLMSKEIVVSQDHEDMVKIMRKDAQGNFVKGTVGMFPVRFIDWSKPEPTIAKTSTTVSTASAPTTSIKEVGPGRWQLILVLDQWSEADKGWQKVNLPAGKLDIAFTGGKVSFLKKNGTKIEFPAEGIPFKENPSKDFLPMEDENFGKFILKIGDKEVAVGRGCKINNPGRLQVSANLYMKPSPGEPNPANNFIWNGGSWTFDIRAVN